MSYRFRVVTFDLDPASLASLREALPQWEIEVVSGATATSLSNGWDPGGADLLVVRAREEPENATEMLELCRFLAHCRVFSTDVRKAPEKAFAWHGRRRNPAQRADAPLLVLVPPGQEPLVRAALEAGADSCLILPVHHKHLATAVSRAHEGNRPGRHTLSLDHAQCDDRWRDDGGEG